MTTKPTTKHNIRIVENKILIDDEVIVLEKKLVKKLERVVRGITQKHPKEDAVFINEGKEGKGKTNTSIVEAAYVKIRTGREAHLFFKIDDLIKFAQSNKNKIIIWDEPSLDSLSTDQLSKLNRNMLRLFMTIRKKRHFFIVNFTKFWKFPEYIIVDRSNGLVHMREDKIGKFLFIRKIRLEFLWNQYRTKHKRSYKKAMSFGGRMPLILEKHFGKLGFHINGKANATYRDYEKLKDEAIGTIGNDLVKKDYNKIKLDELRRKVSKLKGITQVDKASQLEMGTSRLREWKKIAPQQ